MYIGVDLGQQSDYTAIAVVRERGDDLHVVHLERMPLGTDYIDVVARVMRIYHSRHLWTDGEPPTLAIDETGVGRGISDLLRVEDVPFHAVTITSAGEPRPYACKGARTSWRVPKSVLVEGLEHRLRNGSLKIAPSLRWAPALVQELQTFRRKIDERTAHVRYEHNKETDKDDLVLACALATWSATTALVE